MPANHCYMLVSLAAFAAPCNIGLRDDLVTPMHLFSARDSSSQHSSAETELYTSRRLTSWSREVRMSAAFASSSVHSCTYFSWTMAWLRT